MKICMHACNAKPSGKLDYVILRNLATLKFFKVLACTFYSVELFSRSIFINVIACQSYKEGFSVSILHHFCMLL